MGRGVAAQMACLDGGFTQPRQVDASPVIADLNRDFIADVMRVEPHPALFWLASGAPLLLGFDPMRDRITQQLEQRLLEEIADLAVDLRRLSANVERDGLPKIS